MKKIRVLVGLFFIFSLIVVSYGQKENKSPVELKIAVEKIDLCSENAITLSASLTNTRDDEIVINPMGIGDLLHFSVTKIKSGRLTSSNKTIINDSGKDFDLEYVTLKPNQSYEKKVKISLDNDFFNQKGKYKITIAYRQFQKGNDNNKDLWKGIVYSEPLIINLQQCE